MAMPLLQFITLVAFKRRCRLCGLRARELYDMIVVKNVLQVALNTTSVEMIVRSRFDARTG